jgi:hypothetical protein
MSTTTSTDQFQQSELALIEPDCAAPPNKRPKLSSNVGVIRVLMAKVRSPFLRWFLTFVLVVVTSLVMGFGSGAQAKTVTVNLEGHLCVLPHGPFTMTGWDIEDQPSASTNRRFSRREILTGAGALLLVGAKVGKVGLRKSPMGNGGQ